MNEQIYSEEEVKILLKSLLLEKKRVEALKAQLATTPPTTEKIIYKQVVDAKALNASKAQIAALEQENSNLKKLLQESAPTAPLDGEKQELFKRLADALTQLREQGEAMKQLKSELESLKT